MKFVKTKIGRNMTCPGVKLEKFLLPYLSFSWIRSVRECLFGCGGGFIYFFRKKEIFKIGTDIDSAFLFFSWGMQHLLLIILKTKIYISSVYIKWNEFLHKGLRLDFYRIRRIMRFVILLKTLSLILSVFSSSFWDGNIYFEAWVP